MKKKLSLFVYCLVCLFSSSLKASDTKTHLLQNDSTKIFYSYLYNYGAYLYEERIYTLDGILDKKTHYFYPRDYYHVLDYIQGVPILDSLNHANISLLDSLRKSNISLPIETIYLDHDQVIGAQLSIFYPSVKVLKKEDFLLKVPKGGFTTPFTNANEWGYTPQGVIYGINPDPRYQRKNVYESYDGDGNLLQSSIINGVTSCVVWGYNNRYVIAEVNNAILSDIAYSSFEKRAPGNWSYSGAAIIDLTSPMGTQSYNLSNGNITKSGLSTNKTFQLSFWAKTGANINISGANVLNTITGRNLDGWTFMVKTLTTTGSLTISGTGEIDELRLHPKDAIMTSIAYKPLYGVICKADGNGSTLYYEYDGFQRIKYEKDQNKNIIKSYSYHNK